MIPSDNKDVKAAALAMAARGWRVFPCRPKAKVPATANGFKDASADPAVVEKMFNGGAYNVGVATGAGSGFWALDLDGADGLAALARLEAEHGPLPTTISQHTGGGGRQLFFGCNGADNIRNKVKLGGAPIDVRGCGGYVVVPPSIHPTGNRYEWEHDPATTPLVPAPEWLVKWVSAPTATTPRTKSLVLSVKATVDDLATAPGATEGARHDTALRLIGAAIGRGGDAAAVARQAVEWGRRCTPPMKDEDILKIVSDLSVKDSAKIEAEIDEEPLPEPVEWPVLGADAYHGIAGEIVRAIEPQTEADPAAILVQFLVSAGNMIGRTPYYIVEGTPHHANLFSVLVGSTARGRKGTSEGRVRQVLRFIDDAWCKNIKTGLVSGEGLIWHVRDPIYKMENIKKGGRIVDSQEVLADPGVDDKRLLVVESEFASILRVCRREQNTLSPTIRAAWDSGDLRTLAKNSPVTATDAHISIIGHITAEELRRTLAEVDGFSGFANRFLWVAVRRSKLLPDGGADLDLTPQAERLFQTLTAAKAVDRLQRDPAATALWRRSYPALADDDPGGLLGAVTSRAEAQVLRLSVVYALLDGIGTIQQEHLAAALAVWRYCRKSAEIIFGKQSGDPMAERVLEIIKQQPGINRRGIYAASGGHLKGAALVEILARLRDAGRVRVQKIGVFSRICG